MRAVEWFTFTHGGNWNKQGGHGHVTLMWLAVLSSAISYGHSVLWRNPLGLQQKKKKKTERAHVGLLKCPKASLEVAWYPRVPWPRYSRKVSFNTKIIHLSHCTTVIMIV